MCVCARACVRACVRARVCVCKIIIILCREHAICCRQGNNTNTLLCNCSSSFIPYNRHSINKKQ